MSRPRHTARGIIIHQDQILLIERWRPGKHYYSIPGGGIDPGETPEQTVLREITEETGCQVRLGPKLYLLHAADGSQHHIFRCDYLSGEPYLPADSPEALANDPDNRFKPVWLPLTELAAAPFAIWRPVQQQLVHDLARGFASATVALSENVIP